MARADLYISGVGVCIPETVSVEHAAAAGWYPAEHHRADVRGRSRPAAVPVGMGVRQIVTLPGSALSLRDLTEQPPQASLSSGMSRPCARPMLGTTHYLRSHLYDRAG